MSLFQGQEIFFSPNIFPNPRSTVTEISPLTCFSVKLCPLQALFNKFKQSPGCQLIASLTPWPENRHQMPSLLTRGTRMLADEEPAESYKVDRQCPETNFLPSQFQMVLDPCLVQISSSDLTAKPGKDSVFSPCFQPYNWNFRKWGGGETCFNWQVSPGLVSTLFNCQKK